MENATIQQVQKDIINDVVSSLLVAERMEDLRGKRIDAKVLSELGNVQDDFKMKKTIGEYPAQCEFSGNLTYNHDVEVITIVSRLNLLGHGIQTEMELRVCDAGVIYVETRKGEIHDKSMFSLNSVDINDVVQHLTAIDINIKKDGARAIYLNLRETFRAKVSN